MAETQYPLYFRRTDSAKLGADIKARHSVVLMGMKRVGISNFLRFFLYHQKIIETYVKDQKKHLFIPVDLNDMVEREIFPFWILTFKRIVDAVETQDIPFEVKQAIEDLFLESIQLNDQFLLIENIRKSLMKLIELKFIPTLFFIRFDRISESTTENLLANLKGLQYSMHSVLSFVITCFRPLEDLAPKLDKTMLGSFTIPMYFTPATFEEQEVLLEMFQVRYNLTLTGEEKKQLYTLTGGHVRFLQLVLIFLHEQSKKKFKNLLPQLLDDERIVLQSEELWESLTNDEKQALISISQNKTPTNLKKCKYLIDTGFVVQKQNEYQIFSSLLEHYIQTKINTKTSTEANHEFTRKELALFNYLKENLGEVCERDHIIEAVWTDEEEALEVSDWAMDRLVARVRAKLKKQKTPYEIQTIRTRGYKLIQA